MPDKKQSLAEIANAAFPQGQEIIENSGVSLASMELMQYFLGLGVAVAKVAPEHLCFDVSDNDDDSIVLSISDMKAPPTNLSQGQLRGCEWHLRDDEQGANLNVTRIMMTSASQNRNLPSRLIRSLPSIHHETEMMAGDPVDIGEDIYQTTLRLLPEKLHAKLDKIIDQAGSTTSKTPPSRPPSQSI